MELHIAALFFDEVPDARVELVARIFKAGMTIFLKSALVDNPSLEAGMIGARNIPGRFATEAIVASKGILDSDSKAVADVKIAISVRRRHDQGITIVGVGLVAIVDGSLGLERTGLLPEGVDVWLKFAGFVAFGKLHKLILEFKFGLHSGHFCGSRFELALAGPIFIDREKMDMSMGNVGTDNFNHSALAEDIFHMAGELLDGVHDGEVIFVAQIVNAVDFDFGDD